MKTIIKIIAIAIFFLTTGCAITYVPNTVNTPMFSNKGEIQASAYVGSSGFDPQLAYAVSDHIGIMANGSFANHKSDSTTDYEKHKFGEIGIGYYTKNGNNMTIEFFGGFGLGEIKSRSDAWLFTDESDIKSNRFFLQPAVGVSNTNGMFSFTPRFVVYNATRNNITYSRSFIEPTITGRVGFNNIMFTGQLGYSFSLFSTSPTKDDYLLDYNPLIISIGIHLALNRHPE